MEWNRDETRKLLVLAQRSLGRIRAAPLPGAEDADPEVDRAVEQIIGDFSILEQRLAGLDRYIGVVPRVAVVVDALDQLARRRDLHIALPYLDELHVWLSTLPGDPVKDPPPPPDLPIPPAPGKPPRERSG